MSILQPFNALRAALNTMMMPMKIIGSYAKKATKLKIPPWVRYGMHLILLGVLVAVLVFLNLKLGWYLQIDAPNWVRFTWPGLVAILIYAAIRLVFYIIAQIPTAQTEFPDIDEAIETGLGALEDANLSIRDVPLFLVVGLTPQEERSFVESALVGKDVRVIDNDLPVHWYGDHRAIWVTIPGVSAIVAQSKLSASAVGKASTSPSPESGPADFGATLGGAESARFSTIGGADRFSTRAAGTISETAAPLVEGYHAPTRRLDADERDRHDARMRYFVNQLRDARYPVCPINGVLLTVPYGWTTSPGLSQLADTVKIDMFALQETIGVKAMTILALTGIEHFPEFKTYIERLDRDQVERRCGCGYPSLISPTTDDVEKTHTWVVQYFERQVFELFQRKLGDATNGELFRLLDRIRKSRANIVRILKNAFPDDVDEPLYLSGLYFASLEGPGAVRLPFFEGLLARLAREHDDVIGWNNAAMREDRTMQNVARWILVAAAVLVIIDAVVILSMFVPIGI